MVEAADIVTLIYVATAALFYGMLMVSAQPDPTSEHLPANSVAV